MAISSTTKRRFWQVFPKGLAFEDGIKEQFEWWANDAESIIGLVARERLHRRWLSIVFVRKVSGEFRIFNLQLGMPARHVARSRLLEAMATAEEPEAEIRREGSAILTPLITWHEAPLPPD